MSAPRSTRTPKWRRTPFRWRRNLPLALAFLGVLLAFAILLPLPTLQAFDGIDPLEETTEAR